ncbi:20551_t:CDS:2, partial [Gigaspora margarita]
DIPQKKRHDVKKSLLSFITHFFPDEEKIHAADQPQSELSGLRDTLEELFFRKSLNYMKASNNRLHRLAEILLRNFIDILDACKMADFMLLILSAKVEVDQFGELCLKAIQSQGFP